MNTRIEIVAPADKAEAMRFLVGGSRRDEFVAAQARTFYDQTAGRFPESSRLWLAHRWLNTVAAAMVFENAGKTGMLFASPADAPGVDRGSLVELIAQVSRSEVRRGLSMVQALLPPEATVEIAVMEDAGLAHLTELIYMRLDVAGLVPTHSRSDLAWRGFEEIGQEGLGDVIRRTYVQSLDCPGLEGVRRIEDVIAGHKASGVFCPQSWWVVCCQGQPAGCLLVNDFPDSNSQDIVYLGVVPEFRGRGLGRAMVQRAAEQAGSSGRPGLTLAVDSQNAPAMRLYESSGFVAMQRRVGQVLTWKMMQG